MIRSKSAMLLRHAIIAFGINSAEPALAAGSSVLVRIDGIRIPRGTIYASLCRRTEFMTAKCMRAASSPVTDTKPVQLSFEDVPPGEYAVQVVQDVNENRRLDRDSWGAPSEPSGVSRTPARTGQLPRFEDSAFRVSQSNTLVTVELR